MADLVVIFLNDLLILAIIKIQVVQKLWLICDIERHSIAVVCLCCFSIALLLVRHIPTAQQLINGKLIKNILN